MHRGGKIPPFPSLAELDAPSPPQFSIFGRPGTSARADLEPGPSAKSDLEPGPSKKDDRGSAAQAAHGPVAGGRPADVFEEPMASLVAGALEHDVEMLVAAELDDQSPLRTPSLSPVVPRKKRTWSQLGSVARAAREQVSQRPRGKQPAARAALGPVPRRLRRKTPAAQAAQRPLAPGGRAGRDAWRAMAPGLACTHPGCDFVAGGATPRTQYTTMNRHVREKHTQGGATRKKRRQETQRQRLSLRRCVGAVAAGRGLGGAQARGGVGVGATSYKMYVTCPPSRNGYFTALLKRFAAAGFSISCIHRRKGIDYAQYMKAAARAAKTPAAKVARRFGRKEPPKGLQSSQFLHWNFWANFLPTAQAAFKQNPTLRSVFWMEDDAAFRKGGATCPADLVLEACENCWPAAAWCGYVRIGGKPTYQSHLVAVTPESCGSLRCELHAENVGSWCGLDTAIRNVQARRPELVKCPPTSLSYQIKHTLRGRRAAA